MHFILLLYCDTFYSGPIFLFGREQAFNMSSKAAGKTSANFKSPAMKKWQKTHLKGQNEQTHGDKNETISGFLTPTVATFLFFMLAGMLTAGDSWGIIPAFAMTMVFWPIVSVVIIVYYKTKSNDSRMRGAMYSFFVSIVPILITVVFGGLLQT